MGRIAYPDWYVDSIDMWARSFILIGMWNRVSCGLTTRSLRSLTCPVALLILTWHVTASPVASRFIVAESRSGASQRLGPLQEGCRSRIRIIAAPRSGAGASLERCRGRTRTAVASRSVAGASKRQRCSVWELYRSVIGALQGQD